jgi:hypothetical protein
MRVARVEGIEERHVVRDGDDRLDVGGKALDLGVQAIEKPARDLDVRGAGTHGRDNVGRLSVAPDVFHIIPFLRPHCT